MLFPQFRLSSVLPRTLAFTAVLVGLGWHEPLSNGRIEFSMTTARADEAVTLTAQQAGNEVWLSWQGGVGANMLGFNVYRETLRADGNWGGKTRLNAALIAGPAFGDSTEASGAYGWLAQTSTATASSRYSVEGFHGNGVARVLAVAIPVAVDGLPVGAQSSTTITDLGRQSGVRLPQATTTTVDMPRYYTAIPTGNLATQREIASRVAMKILVQRSGWTRVTASQLFAAGLSTDTNPASLRLFVEGNSVPLKVPAKTTLATNDIVEFYGQAFDLPTTGTRVYWLVSGYGAKNALTVRPSVTIGTTPQEYFWCTVEDKPRSIYYVGLLNGSATNFFGPIVSSTALTRTLPVTNRLQPPPLAKTAVLVGLQGVTTAEHSVTVLINGQAAGTVTWSGREAKEVELPIAGSLLNDGDNTVTLTAASDEDLSLLMYVRLRYCRKNIATGNSLVFQAPGSSAARVSGFTNSAIHVIDTTVPEAPFEIPVEADGAGAVKFQVRGSGTRYLHAYAGTFSFPAAGVEAGAQASLHLTTNKGGYLIVAPKAFKSSLSALVDRRSSEGRTVKIANLEGVIDQFGYGIHSPQALRSFFAYAKNNWQVKPKFVLLVGDASYDPRNYLGLGDQDILPTKLIDSSQIETASDDWLTDFNNDGVGDIPTGRLPVSTAEQATAVAGRIAAYHADSTRVPGRQSVLISDTLRGYDFEGACDAFEATLPSGAPVLRIRRTDGDAAARSALLAAWSNSPVLVTYFGHGATDIWSGAPLLANKDAASLDSKQPQPFVMAMTCLTNYFISPSLVSLGESLETAAGGAIAVWGSSGQSIPNDQQSAAEELARTLYPASGTAPTLGEAILKAKAAVTDTDVRSTWILLGDPAMTLARPQAASAGFKAGSARAF